MRTPARMLAAALSVALAFSADRPAPVYSAASVVNSASNEPSRFAPNTFLTIYGANLAFVTRALQSSDLHGAALPTVLPGTGVTVAVNHIPAQILYVSPTQVNAVIPADAITGPAVLQLTLDNLNGPAINFTIQDVAPALFQLDALTPIAVHADASLVTPAAPSKPGELVVLYATGLGDTLPRQFYGEIPTAAARARARIDILLNGTRIDPASLLYAGIAPGFPALYQINLILPPDTPANPEIRLQSGAVQSKPGIILPVATQNPPVALLRL